MHVPKGLIRSEGVKIRKTMTILDIEKKLEQWASEYEYWDANVAMTGKTPPIKAKWKVWD